MNISPETSLLIAHLKACYESDELARFEELEKIVPKIRNSKRYYLVKALNILSQEYGYCFESVRILGYRPLNDHGSKLQAISRKRNSRIYNQVGKWRQEWGTIEPEALTPEDTKNYIAVSIKLSAHEQLHNPEFDRRVTAIAANTNQSTNILYSREAIKALIDVS